MRGIIFFFLSRFTNIAIHFVTSSLLANTEFTLATNCSAFVS
jgi:hypothetical protein